LPASNTRGEATPNLQPFICHLASVLYIQRACNGLFTNQAWAKEEAHFAINQIKRGKLHTHACFVLPLRFSFQDHRLGQDDTKNLSKVMSKTMICSSLFFYFSTYIGKGHSWVLGLGGNGDYK
jgi:hypothetical protein